jgi:hypothetical protein
VSAFYGYATQFRLKAILVQQGFNLTHAKAGQVSNGNPKARMFRGLTEDAVHWPGMAKLADTFCNTGMAEKISKVNSGLPPTGLNK